jgi:hypothetical protein
MDPDPDPGGPKTCGSGSATLSGSIGSLGLQMYRYRMVRNFFLNRFIKGSLSKIRRPFFDPILFTRRLEIKSMTLERFAGKIKSLNH